MEQLLHRLLTSVGQFGDNNPEVRGAALLGLSTLILSSLGIKVISKLRGKKEVKKEEGLVSLTFPQGQYVEFKSGKDKTNG